MSKIFDKLVASIYPLYLAKVEKKGRTRDELDEVIRWLTGFDQQTIQHRLTEEATVRDFFAEAALNENASLITGSMFGVSVENVDDPLLQEIRYLDKILRAAALTRAWQEHSSRTELAKPCALSGPDPAP